MAGSQDGGRRPEDVQWQRVQSQSGQWADSDEEEEPALYRTDEFRIQVMKVLRCSKKYCHDWTRCPFAHPGEKATRRDPMLGIYTGIACPDMKKDQRCPRGHYCPYAHNVFEYWLHPTRYRTALCRDVERCTRKICFFAHEVREIRTNVERPYVSPEQLVAATEAATQDPRVQAEYHAAADEQRRNSKPGLMTGLFNTLDEPTDTDPNVEQLQNLSLSLPAPAPSQENQEVMQALSSLMRGDMGPLSNPYTAANAASTGRQSGGTFRSLTHPGAGPPESSIVTGPGGLPSLDQRVRRSASDPISRHPPRVGSYRSQEADMLRQQPSIGQSVNTIDEMAPSMFPDHLNTMVQMPSQQSWGSQQNLMNAAAHLFNDQQASGSSKEPSIWSTPRSPLEQLYSTASSLSDRQSSMEGPPPNRLESAYKQKLRKRLADRREAAAAAQPYNSGYPPPTPGIMGPTPSGMVQRDRLQTMPAVYSWNNPHLEFTRQIQQQQAMQAQAYHQQQQMQEVQMALQQQAYQQEIRNQLQQAIQTEIRHHGLNRSQHQSQHQHSSGLETGFDLRFGGLGENQGLFSQPQGETNAAQPHLLHTQLTTAAMLYTAPQTATAREMAGEGQLPQMHRASSAAAELGLARQNSTAAQSQGGDEDPAAKAEALNSASSGYMAGGPTLEAALNRMNMESAPAVSVPTTTINA